MWDEGCKDTMCIVVKVADVMPVEVKAQGGHACEMKYAGMFCV